MISRQMFAALLCAFAPLRETAFSVVEEFMGVFSQRREGKDRKE
jgi:hypothetical protein